VPGFSCLSYLLVESAAPRKIIMQGSSPTSSPLHCAVAGRLQKRAAEGIVDRPPGEYRASGPFIPHGAEQGEKILGGLAKGLCPGRPATL
jgi:hypothetical protein